MLLPRKLAMIMLAIWLIMVGLSGFINLGDLRKILDVVAVVAGILILLSR